jgi:hypothetical protein
VSFFFSKCTDCCKVCCCKDVPGSEFPQIVFGRSRRQCENEGGVVVPCPPYNPCDCDCDYENSVNWDGESATDWLADAPAVGSVLGCVPDNGFTFIPITQPMPGFQDVGPYHYVYVARTIEYFCGSGGTVAGTISGEIVIPAGRGFIASVSIWPTYIQDATTLDCAGGYFKSWLYLFPSLSVDDGMCPLPNAEPIELSEIITPPNPSPFGGICPTVTPETVQDLFDIDVTPYVTPPTITLECTLQPYQCEQ